jgi:gliding motility-associated-like protein
MERIRLVSKFLYIIFPLSIFSSLNQAFSQVDTQFWFAAPDISQSHGDSPVQIVFTAYDLPADITITQPANPNFPQIKFSLPRFSSLSYDLSNLKILIESSGVDAVNNTALLVHSTSLVTGYYLVNGFLNPDIFAFKGNNALGTEFVVVSAQHVISRRDDGYNAALILATEDNTKVTILPSVDLIGHKKKLPFQILLNRGQVYVAASAKSSSAGNQIGGTFISSDKAISVILSDDSVSLPGNGCEDLNGDQLIPICLAGNEHITMPGSLNVSIGGKTGVTDIVYIYATEDNTEIEVNGVGFGAKRNKGEYFSVFNQGKSNYIYSDKPVLLYQLGGNGCEVGGAVVPTVTRSGLNFSSATRLTDENFFINILTKTDFKNGFEIAGIKGNYLINWTDLNNNWSSGRINLSNTQLINPGQTVFFKNLKGNFNLGWINGGGLSGTRYGYFSNFSISMDQSEVIISSSETKAEFSIANPQGLFGYFEVSFDSGLSWIDVNSNTADFILSGPFNSVLTATNSGLIDGLLVRYIEVSGDCSIKSAISRLTISLSDILALDDSVTTSANIPITGNVLANDIESNGDQLSVVTFSVNGTIYLAGETITFSGIGDLTLNKDGSFYFAPSEDYFGDLPPVQYDVVNKDRIKKSAVLKISVEPKSAQIYLRTPNAFSPNGDGINDCFFPVFTNLKTLNFWVLNRWGEMIFYTNKFEHPGWDGIIEGIEAPQGDYVYKVSYETVNGIKRTEVGTFLLMR